MPDSALGNTTLVVRVVLPNERSAGRQINVRLQPQTGGVAAERFTDEQGKAEFANVRAGLYDIKVSGANIQSASSGVIQIQTFENIHDEYVHVQPTDAATSLPQNTVSEAELNIPKDAMKEFEKGNQEAAKGDKDKAIEHFRLAVQLYPKFASAHNNLAALYMQSNDFPRAQQELDAALAADPESPKTFANIVKLKLIEKKYDEAISVSGKALAKEPKNPELLFLMSKAQFQAGKYDQALVYARKIYAGPHQDFELSHIIAGRCLELTGKPKEAEAEYQALLKESPKAPEAAEASKSIARLDKMAEKK